ncbi:MAG TPA: DJ-1/PfpI family protein [Lacunisphaera sp.]|jgi:transcriptional regulator GlxA family with amidase domain
MRRNTAILIFENVEVLDFAGPLEVFSTADELSEKNSFRVFTVAEAPGTIRTNNGLKIIPEHTLESSPVADLLIVPGGFGTRALLNKPSVIEWIRVAAKRAEIVASVCTGALLLAKAGLLNNQPATTHYLTYDLLREIAPTALIHEDRRFLDNGPIATSAGISAGIDLSLHLVARLQDATTAEKTARHMEYHWRNDGGLQR